MSYDDYRDFCRNRIWDALFVEAFFNGNILEGQSIECFNTLNRGFNAYKPYARLLRSDWNEHCRTPVVNLRKKTTHIVAKHTLNAKEENCAIVKHFQLSRDLKLDMLQDDYYRGIPQNTKHKLGDMLPVHAKNPQRPHKIKEFVILNWLATWLQNTFYADLRTNQQ